MIAVVFTTDELAMCGLLYKVLLTNTQPFSILLRLTVPRHPSIRAHQGKLGFGKVYFPYASLSDGDVNSVQSGVCGSQVMLMKVIRRNDAPGHQHRSGVTSRPPFPVPSLPRGRKQIRTATVLF